MKFYIAEIINLEDKDVEYTSETYSTKEEAIAYVLDTCDDRFGLDGIVIEINAEKHPYKQMIESTKVVFST